jgi:hypothetical protein
MPERFWIFAVFGIQQSRETLSTHPSFYGIATQQLGMMFLLRTRTDCGSFGGGTWGSTAIDHGQTPNLTMVIPYPTSNITTAYRLHASQQPGTSHLAWYTHFSIIIYFPCAFPTTSSYCRSVIHNRLPMKRISRACVRCRQRKSKCDMCVFISNLVAF